jgi:hypothetical protein
MITFTLSDEEEVKYEAWKAEVRKRAIKKQKEQIKETHEFYRFYKTSWEMGYPYTGTIGGGTTFEFTPTGLGTVVRVKDAITGEELDLTDYDFW